MNTIAKRQTTAVIFFEDNLPSPQAAMDLTQAFREAAGTSIPLLCLDQEGGAVVRLRTERGFEPGCPAMKLPVASSRIRVSLFGIPVKSKSSISFASGSGSLGRDSLRRNHKSAATPVPQLVQTALPG
jgi:hypothetical protein